jgi:hypothetical protein
LASHVAEDLDGVVRQLQQLQDAGQRADRVDVLVAGVVDLGGALRHQQDLLVVLHRRRQGLDRLLAPDEQRDRHVRVDDHVAQREYGGQTIVFQGQLLKGRAATATTLMLRLLR